MALGNRIALEREAQGMTQTTLCTRVNRMTREGDKELTQQALDRLEKRDSNASVFAIRIADALGVSVRWLLDGQGDKAALDWPFPDQDLLPQVMRMTRDQRVEVQGAIRDKVTQLASGGAANEMAA